MTRARDGWAALARLVGERDARALFRRVHARVVDPRRAGDVPRRLVEIDVALSAFSGLQRELAAATAVEAPEATDGDELLRGLLDVRALLDGLAVAAVVDDAIVAACARWPDAPDVVAQRRRRAIAAVAPTCACGSATTLRESDYGPFWGCVEFPRCRGLRRLTPRDLDALSA